MKRLNEIIKAMQIFQDQWEDCSCGTNTLTEKGLMNVYRLTKKYSEEMILEAMLIAWSVDYVADEEKFTYMCGVLKHMESPYNTPTNGE